MGETNAGRGGHVDLAMRVLDAHVAFTKQQLREPAGFLEFVTEEIDGALDEAAELTLAEAVTREQIKAVAHKFAVQVPVEGAIPELVGEIATRLYNHRANDEIEVGRLTRTGARFVLRGTSSDVDEVLLDSARETWRKHTGDAVGSFRDLVSATDVEDIVVLVFEFWRTFRDTDYFRALLDEGVDHVFDKYGDTPLPNCWLSWA